MLLLLRWKAEGGSWWVLGLAPGFRPACTLLLWGCCIITLLSSCCALAAKITFGNQVPEVAGASTQAMRSKFRKTSELHVPWEMQERCLPKHLRPSPGPLDLVQLLGLHFLGSCECSLACSQPGTGWVCRGRTCLRRTAPRPVRTQPRGLRVTNRILWACFLGSELDQRQPSPVPGPAEQIREWARSQATSFECWLCHLLAV